MTQAQTPTSPVDGAFVEEFLPRWLEAWNSHTPERLLALMTDDIAYDDASWPRTMHGHADVREFLDHAWTGLPDLRFEVKHGPFLHPTEPQATVSWRGSATHTGPIDPPGLAPTGRRLEFEGFDWHLYRDGKVARLWICFDMGAVMRDLGVLPAPGTREERLTAKMSNVRAMLRRRAAHRG